MCSVISFQKKIEDRRTQINSQCDSLISEIETKREFFLSDLEYEQKSKTDSLMTQVAELEKKSVSLQGLVHYTKEVLNEVDNYAFLQVR